MQPDKNLGYRAIVQLNPETTRNKAFGGCLMIVTEPKQWGAQGYVQALGPNRDELGGLAYYRATWDEMEPTGGTAEWIASCERPSNDE